mgnify:CR=1 FL=1
MNRDQIKHLIRQTWERMYPHETAKLTPEQKERALETRTDLAEKAMEPWLRTGYSPMEAWSEAGGSYLLPPDVEER